MWAQFIEDWKDAKALAKSMKGKHARLEKRKDVQNAKCVLLYK